MYNVHVHLQGKAGAKLWRRHVADHINCQRVTGLGGVHNPEVCHYNYGSVPGLLCKCAAATRLANFMQTASHMLLNMPACVAAQSRP